MSSDPSPEEVVAKARERRIFVFDLETTGLDPRSDRIEGIAFYVPPTAPRKKDDMRAWFPFVEGTGRSYSGSGAQFKIEDRWPALPQPQIMEALRPLFEDSPGVVAIAHNAKFDVSMLRVASGCERGFWEGAEDVLPAEKLGPGGVMGFRSAATIADSMLADFIADETHYAYGLKTRVKDVFGHVMTTYKEARNRTQSLLPFATDALRYKPLGVYAMEDCYWTWRLFQDALRRMRAQTPGRPAKPDDPPERLSPLDGQYMGSLERYFWRLNLRVLLCVIEMQLAGVCIDWRYLLNDVAPRLEEEKAAALARIEETFGVAVNPNKHDHVARILYAQPPTGLGLDTKLVRRDKAGPSTASKEIKRFAAAHPVIDDIITWRSRDTLLSSFVYKLGNLAASSPDGRIYSQFNQTRTVIGRLSSSDPVNLQNQPRAKGLVRKAFCAYTPDDERQDLLLFGADYSQIELRMAAYFSGDPGLVEVYECGKPCNRGPDGGPCERYQMHECLECSEVMIPEDGRCAKCGSDKTEHQERCRHVDVHQRTAEDAKVPRNPLAKCLDGSTLVFAEARGKDLPVRVESLAPYGPPGQHVAVDGLKLWDGRRRRVKAISGIRRYSRPTSVIITRQAVLIATDDHRIEVLGDHPKALPAGTPGYKHVPGRSLVALQDLRVGDRLPLARLPDPGDLTETLSAADEERIRHLVQIMLEENRDDAGVPAEVLSGGAVAVRYFLAVLLEKAAVVNTLEREVLLTLTAPALIGQIATLMRWLRIPVSISVWRRSLDVPMLAIPAFGMRRLLELLPFLGSPIRAFAARCADEDIPPEPLQEDEVLAVRSAGFRTVYDFHVDSDDHIYCQGGLLGHNNLNFGNLYRIGPARFCQYADLYNEDGSSNVAFAADVISLFFDAYPGIRAFQERIESEVRNNGWVMTSLFGRRRRLAKVAKKSEYQAVTKAIQFRVSGSAQDIIQRAMGMVYDAREERLANARPAERKLWRRFRQIIQVHDEILAEGPRELEAEIKQLIEECMVGAVELVARRPDGSTYRIPLTTDVKAGRTWDDVH